MKKLLSVLLCLLVLLSACGQKEEEAPKKEFTIGETKDYTYSNDFFDVMLTLDSDWYIASENELANIQSEVVDQVTNESAAKLFEDGQAVYVFYGQEMSSGANIQVVIEELPVENAKAEQIAKNNIPLIHEQFKSMNVEDIKIETADIKTSDDTLKGINASVTMNGVPVLQRQIYLLNGKYLMSIGITALTEAEIAEYTECISKIK